MVLVRRDVHEQWGGPTGVDEGLAPLSLDQVLRSVPDMSPAWLPTGTHVRWSTATPPGSTVDPTSTDPVVVGEVGEGGWGNRIYMHAIPTARASSWDVDGQSQLVAQRRRGVWWARTLLREEVEHIYSHPAVTLTLAAHDGRAVGELGRAGPLRVVRPWAVGMVRFLRPPLQWCPVRLQELISDSERAVCRGWMVQAQNDFKHMKHLR